MSTDVAPKDVEAHKTIKVPLWVYENAKEAELTLLKKGISQVPGDVRQPQSCPICQSGLETFTTEKRAHECLRCPHCGHTQQRFTDRSGEGIVLGTAIGMSLVYFLNGMFKGGSPSD